MSDYENVAPMRALLDEVMGFKDGLNSLLHRDEELAQFESGVRAGLLRVRDTTRGYNIVELTQAGWAFADQWWNYEQNMLVPASPNAVWRFFTVPLGLSYWRDLVDEKDFPGNRAGFATYEDAIAAFRSAFSPQNYYTSCIFMQRVLPGRVRAKSPAINATRDTLEEINAGRLAVLPCPEQGTILFHDYDAGEGVFWKPVRVIGQLPGWPGMLVGLAGADATQTPRVYALGALSTLQEVFAAGWTADYLHKYGARYAGELAVR